MHVLWYNVNSIILEPILTGLYLGGPEPQNTTLCMYCIACGLTDEDRLKIEDNVGCTLCMYCIACGLTDEDRLKIKDNVGCTWSLLIN